MITNRKTKRNIPNSVFYLLKKMYMTVFMLQCVISIAYSYGKIYQLSIIFLSRWSCYYWAFTSVYHSLYFLPTLLSFKCMFVSLVAFEYAFRIQKLLNLENEYVIQRSGICKFGFNERQPRRAKGLIRIPSTRSIMVVPKT